MGEYIVFSSGNGGIVEEYFYDKNEWNYKLKIGDENGVYSDIYTEEDLEAYTITVSNNSSSDSDSDYNQLKKLKKKKKKLKKRIARLKKKMKNGY